MTPDEQVSFRHLTHYLGGYDKFLVIPEGLALSRPGFAVRRFAPSFFRSVGAYSNLLLTRGFYEAFAGYDYILIYQFDCLVFSDRLREWCEAGYDYIGAPWFESHTDPSLELAKVGNGGLSLRRVSSFLAVIDSVQCSESRARLLRELGCGFWEKHAGLSGGAKWRAAARAFPVSLMAAARYAAQRRGLKGAARFMSAYPYNEDIFWSERAVWFHPPFSVAPPEVGLRFAFEHFPRLCFDLNDRALPFGCHGWPRFDKEFWRPFLIG
jgi:hypothetical protein